MAAPGAAGGGPDGAVHPAAPAQHGRNRLSRTRRVDAWPGAHQRARAPAGRGRPDCRRGYRLAGRPRARREGLGLWLLALATANLVLQVVENAGWLSMLSLSQAYAAASGADAENLRPLAVVVRSSWRWAHYSHILIVVGWLFTAFLTMFRCALVPRGLGAFGMFCSVLHTVGITLPVFAGYRMAWPELFGMPLALAILSMASWLVARGFDERTPAPRAL